MGQRFDRRGKRTDEMLELMRALWQPGWTEFDGEFYQTPRLEMEPTPPHIPIYVGGMSDIALRRAARHDGWIGDLITTERAIERIDDATRTAGRKGLTMDGFTILTPLTDAFTPDYERAEAAASPGFTMPWMFYTGRSDRSPRRSTGCAVPEGYAARRLTSGGLSVGTTGGQPVRRVRPPRGSKCINREPARPAKTSSRNAEAVQHGEFAAVDQRPEILREVLGEVGERHLAADDESGDASEQSDRDQDAEDQLDDAGLPEGPRAHGNRGPWASRTSSGWHGREQQPEDDPEQADHRGRNSIQTRIESAHDPTVGHRVTGG